MRKLVFLFAGLLAPAMLVAQLSQQWASTYTGPYVTSSAYGWSITTDQDGYVYACGYVVGKTQDNDYVTIKYDPSTGDTLWSRCYNGPMNSGDQANAIAVDNSGGVYVTGYSYGSGTERDAATVKYSSADGSQLWVARYNGPGNDADIAKAIAVDNSGGVYVAGTSNHSHGTAYDFATVKYNASDGSQAWAASYNGPGNGEDAASGIAVDNSGGVYVTGSSGSGTGADCATIRYEASDGSQTWVGRYDGPGNSVEHARGIAVDNSGGVYITALSVGSGGSSGYATVSYSASDGSQNWVARYDDPSILNKQANAIAVDNSGGVYVTGSSNDGGSTIRYDATNGDESWVARYNAYGRAIALDNSGGVYVAGYSIDYQMYTTIRYDAAGGSRSWVVNYDGPGNNNDEAQAIAVDNSGGVYVTGLSSGSGTGCDLATIGYVASNGTQNWATRWNSPGRSAECGLRAATDADGYMYVCGSGDGPGGNTDYITIKYDPATGETLWVRYYNGPGNGTDSVPSVAVDNTGGVYVTGYSTGSGTGYDYATVRYNASDGSQTWVSRYNGPGNSYDRASAIAVDNAGGVYVTGYSTGSGTDYDCATIRYNATNGGQNWVARYNDPANKVDYAQAIAVDNSGGVYVTGYSAGPFPYGDYVTMKYNTSGGDQSWVACYNGPLDGYDMAYAIAVDNSGGVYVTGASYGAGSGYDAYDYATVKYDASTGSQRWAARYDGPGNRNDEAHAIALDNSGGVYVTGQSTGSGTGFDGFDYATIKYGASTGSQRWVARYDGPGNRRDQATAIAVDETGGVYVTGYSFGSGTGLDYATVLYSQSNGAELGSDRCSGSASYDDQPFSIASGSSSNVYVTGRCLNDRTLYDIVTIKYLGHVGLVAPEQPALVSPANEATNQEVSGQLEWQTAEGADFYDVCFGTDPHNLPVVSSNQENLTFDYSGLACGTTYRWKVVAKNAAGETESDVWSFATGTVDAGVTEILDPSGVIDTLVETPRSTVRNFGTTARDVTAWFEIRDSTKTVVYLQSAITPALPGGDEVAVSFPDWDVPDDKDGPYCASSWIIMVDDRNPANDTARSQFAVEAKQQGPPSWLAWPDAPTGPQNRDIGPGAALAADAAGLCAYLLKGHSTCEFYQFEPAAASWTALDPIPEVGRSGRRRTVREGGTLAEVNGKLYATKGDCLEFWEYDPAALPGYRWTQKADVPAGTKDVQSGAGAAGVKIGVNGFVYLLKASETFEFYRYNVAQDSWGTCADAPGDRETKWGEGSCLSNDGIDTVFALKGGENEFYAYIVSNNTWLAKPDLPLGSKKKHAKAGAAICYHVRSVYCLKGGDTQEFWVFDCDGDTWYQAPDVPLGEHKSRVQDGGALVYCSVPRYLFATKGDCREFWSYGKLSNHGVMGEGVVALPGCGANTYGLTSASALVPGRDRVCFALPSPGHVSLRLYDMAGRVARVLVNGWQPAGRHDVSLQAGNLPQGVYLLRYAAGDYLESRKLIVQR